MYNISEYAMTLLARAKMQEFSIVWTKSNGNSQTITADYIVENSLTIDRRCITGSVIEIGNAIASELQVTLFKHAYYLNFSAMSKGDKLVVSFVIKDWDNPNSTSYTIPCGTYYIDAFAKNDDVVRVRALDAIGYFGDDVADENDLLFHNIAYAADYAANYISGNNYLGTIGNNFTMCYIATYGSDKPPTYRNILQWCAFLNGGNVYMDANNRVRFMRYKEDTQERLTQRYRFASDISGTDSFISQFQYDGDGTNWVFGQAQDGGTVLAYHDFMPFTFNQRPPEVYLEEIYNTVAGLTWRSFALTMFSAPYLFPCDEIEFVEEDNTTTHSLIITSMTFTANQNTPMEGLYNQEVF